ncbi:24968_t:CDS:2 [Dentiscutata erythropus]|uniref:24968_t:CDS:1 n=1 Tax=Dentiscutata erythropus TaxID=1348616 RepID=A0A9N8VG45_9GLOM|nr:24968_t:CDS:2 [Dentiscutata erythropus]
MALFIGRLALDTHPRDLEHIFDKYGRLNRLEVKRGYAFVEYQDERDASDAMKETDGLRVRGNRIVVEWAKNGGKKPGHWAKDCRSSSRRDRRRSRSPRRRSRSRSRSPRRSVTPRRDRDRDSRDRDDRYYRRYSDEERSERRHSGDRRLSRSSERSSSDRGHG